MGKLIFIDFKVVRLTAKEADIRKGVFFLLGKYVSIFMKFNTPHARRLISGILICAIIHL